MLRRQNDVIAKYLPAKLDVIVFCTLTEEQQDMYKHTCHEGRVAVQAAEEGGKPVHSSALKAVSSLKRIVNDPEMAKLAAGIEQAGVEGSVATKLSEARSKKPMDPAKSVAMSGKLAAMVELLKQVHAHAACVRECGVHACMRMRACVRAWVSACAEVTRATATDTCALRSFYKLCLNYHTEHFAGQADDRRALRPHLQFHDDARPF